MSSIRVAPLDCSDIEQTDYHLFLGAVGFERRARFAPGRLRTPQSCMRAFAFEGPKCLAFEANLRWFQKRAHSIDTVKAHDFQDWIEELLQAVCKQATTETLRVGFDISSLTRFRIAACLFACMNFPRPIKADFYYAPAKCTRDKVVPEAIESIGPVLAEFAGWSSRPELPTAAVVGLGYEPDRAVGACEYLQATQVWLLQPTGGDPRYQKRIESANRSLLQAVPRDQQLTYSVDRPFHCFEQLESLVAGLSATARPILLPFGPKIFAMCSMTVAAVHRQVPVWRASCGKHGRPVDRIPSGNLVGLQISRHG